MLLTLLLLCAAPAQKGEGGAERVEDPYTRGQPELLERAGYRSLGPFPLAKDLNGAEFGTREVEKALGNIDIRWLETAHFRIGSTLPAYTLSDKKERDALRVELAELARVFPEVDPEERKLDPWLRLHLYAARLEGCYRELEQRLGLGDADFPQQPGARMAGVYRGEGPYLGQPGKYLVLLFERASSVGRFFGRFAGQPEERPRRFNFAAAGVLAFVTSTEYADNSLQNDTALHCSVVFNLTHNLLDGYKYYTMDLPLWFREGMAHWDSRRVDPHWNSFSTEAEDAGDARATWNWPPKVRGRVKNDYYPTAEELLAWDNYDERSFADHMMMWSRVDYLMSLGDAGFARFLDLMKGSEPPNGSPPDLATIQARQREALQQAYGLDEATFDRRWAEFVLKTYPEK